MFEFEQYNWKGILQPAFLQSPCLKWNIQTTFGWFSLLGGLSYICTAKKQWNVMQEWSGLVLVWLFSLECAV